MAGFEAHTIFTISLSDFYAVCLGDAAKAVRKGIATQEQQEDAASALIAAYGEITGGERVRGELMQRDRLCRLEMRIIALGAVLSLCEAGEADGARRVLGELGVKVKDDATTEQMKAKANSLQARDKMQRDMLRKGLEGRAEKGGAATMADFVKERTEVMRHAKMYIDPASFTAAEYAYMVAAMVEEAEAARKQAEEMKTKSKRGRR